MVHIHPQATATLGPAAAASLTLPQGLCTETARRHTLTPHPCTPLAALRFLWPQVLCGASVSSHRPRV